jgi:hypothetical protein
MRLLSLITVILIALPSALLAEFQVTARFDPPRIAMGDPSQYIVAITESGSSQPQIEQIKTLPISPPAGLTFSNGRTSTSQQANYINGSVQYSVTQNLLIQASPTEIGRYTIPAYAFDYKGERVQIPAATLEVLERSANAGPSRSEQVFLRAELPDSLYIGQTVAFDLKLYVAEDVRLDGLNSFDRSADGFTISERKDDISESVEMKNGHRYVVRSWPFTLTPIRTGQQEISFQFGLTARLPNQEKSRTPLGRSPFGGGLFEDFFGRTERLNVYTDSLSINVQPLPEKGKPKSFSGAIGDFAIEVGADSEQANQGEPIMLTVVLKGRGNFDRINGPDFSEGPDWRHYDPERKFEPADALGLSGSKRFDYVFIPQRSGQLELPATQFSYFDPQEKEYVELSAPPLPVKVAATTNSSVPTPQTPTPDMPASGLKLSKSLTPEEALLTLDYRPQPSRAVGYAILSNPLFIGLNAATGLLILGSAGALVRWKRHRADPSYPVRIAARQSLKEARNAYLHARQHNDFEAFFQHGTQAIRHAATLRTGHSMQSADCAQITALLDGQALEDCRKFLAAANARRFGGHSQIQLADAQQQLENILTAL